MHLLKKILNFFIPDTKTDIELFIESKNPKSAADVEHWIQNYNYRRNHHVL
jgi:hypothetical protein